MISIDTQSRTPLVDQVRNALKHAIASEQLLPGQELPSARQLAGDLNIHWNTVSRAYRQLAVEGILFVAHGRKACVMDRDVHGQEPSEDQLNDVKSLLRQGFTQAKLCGLDKETLLAIVNNEFVKWK